MSSVVKWYTNNALIEQIYKKIIDFDTFLNFSKSNLKIAQISNNVRIQQLITDRFVYKISTNQQTSIEPKTFCLNYFKSSIPLTKKDVKIISTVEGNEIQTLIYNFLKINVCDTTTDNNPDKPNPRYIILWGVGDKNYIMLSTYSTFFSSTPYNTFHFIIRSLYNQHTDKRPGKRVVTVFDTTKTNVLPMYFLI
jgi:hypothetical protein